MIGKPVPNRGSYQIEYGRTWHGQVSMLFGMLVFAPAVCILLVASLAVQNWLYAACFGFLVLLPALQIRELLMVTFLPGPLLIADARGLNHLATLGIIRWSDIEDIRILKVVPRRILSVTFIQIQLIEKPHRSFSTINFLRENLLRKNAVLIRGFLIKGDPNKIAEELSSMHQRVKDSSDGWKRYLQENLQTDMT